MMPGLQEYFIETEHWSSRPRVGDDLDIELAPDELIEGRVIESDGEHIVLEVGHSAVQALEQRSLLSERIRRYGPAASNRGQGFTILEDLDNPMAQAVARRIINQHPEWLSSYGIEFVLQVIDDVTEGESDWEEIGTSDVSAYVKMVHDQLQDRGGSRSGMAEGGGLDPNLHSQTQDYGHGKPDEQEDLPFRPDPKSSYRDEFGNPIKHMARHLARKGMRQAIDQKSDKPVEEDFMPRMLELAGISIPMVETAPIQPNPNAARTDPLAAKAADLAAVGTEKDPTTATTMDEGVMSEIDIDLQSLANRGDEEDLIAALEGDLGPGTAMVLQNMMDEIKDELAAKGMTDVINDNDKMIEILWDKIVDEYSGRDLDEAEYQGRKVQLGKPMQGDVKKFKVYVKDPKTGNVKKVNFGHGGKSAKRAGEKTLSIKKSNPARRRSFRARHNCDNPGPRTKARYWSCRMW